MMSQKIKLKGFTLIELIISMAIMSLMTVVMFADYPESSMRVNLANLTSKISLLIREAQIRGSSVDSGVSGNISGYGLYFNLANPNKVIMFNDLAIPSSGGISVGNGLYDAVESNLVTNIISGFKINKLCTGGGFPFSTCNATTLTVSFTRPNPQAVIYVGANQTPSSDGGACIELYSPRAPKVGHVRSVQVFNSGRISTSNKGCTS